MAKSIPKPKKYGKIRLKIPKSKYKPLKGLKIKKSHLVR